MNRPDREKRDKSFRWRDGEFSPSFVLAMRIRRPYPTSLVATDPLLSGLDADQRRAVLHRSGPLLLVAGAGSGKTRVIVARIARLLREGVPPRQILGITFTNRAADEMRERVAAAADAGAPGDPLPRLGTFHAFGANLLRRFGGRIGLHRGFVIYDGRDQLDLIRQILKDADIDEKKFPAVRMAGLIERAKREGIPIEAAAVSAGWPFVDKAVAVGKAYGDSLAAAGAVDFADLIRLPVALFREAPDVQDAVRGEIRHLLVDEFQDVDRGQAELAGRIGLGAESYCAVGDEDQSIYGWRGGSAGPMLSFEQDHPGATVLHLGTNYRSRASILFAAEQVIGRNSQRREKRILAARGGGEPPRVRAFEDADAEAGGVAEVVAEEIRRGTLPSRISVFYRVNAQSRAVEDALRRAGIPYLLRGALSFYDRAPVRIAVAYLRWFLNPDDPVSLKRLLAAPRRGVGEAALSRARAEAKKADKPLSWGLARISAVASLLSFREKWREELPGRRGGDALRSLLAGAGYLPWLAEGEEGGDRVRAGGGRLEDRENVEELIRLADSVPGSGEEGVRDFLERVSLQPPEESGNGIDAVHLMTLHNAKGLEFDVSFLVGLEEGLLPHTRSAGSTVDVEEERRLFYVGLTRARERVALSFARRRALFGAFRDAAPSRFLSEIPPALLRWEGASAPLGRAQRGEARPPGPRPERDRFRDGKAQAPAAPRPLRVRHPVFGEGRIEASEGEGDNRKITVFFPGSGRKKILVRLVKMEYIS
jgi:DNA helicase-2/ATP-dependent DNA helicase PcrA